MQTLNDLRDIVADRILNDALRTSRTSTVEI